MTGVPKPSDMTGKYTCSYDAWGYLIQVKDGSTIVAHYRYDGLGRRIRKFTPDGANWTVWEYYYSVGWQLLEVRKATGVQRSGDPLSEPPAAGTVREQPAYLALGRWAGRYGR